MEGVPTEAGPQAHVDWATPLCTTIRPQPAIGVPSARKVTFPVGAGLPVNVAVSVVDAPIATVVGLATTEGVVDAVPATVSVDAPELGAKVSLPE
jgi:hypothetical protein